MMKRIFVTGLLLAATLPAAAELIEIQWSADGRFTHTGSIAAGKFAELCGKLPAGAKVRWEFDVGAPVDFNVHYHVDKRVEYPAKRKAARHGKGTLSAAIPQDYCWMWTNKSKRPTLLSVTLER